MDADAVSRNEAIAALLHRLNGGLHNASIALELARDGAGEGRQQMLARGLAGIEQSSRAAQMLDELVRSESGDAGVRGDYLGDVAEILRLQSARRGIALSWDANGRSMVTTSRAAAHSLARGFARLAHATPGVALRIEFGAHEGAPALNVLPE